MSKLSPGWQSVNVLEAVFDQLSDALILYDPEFRITGVNRSAEKLFGMSSEEMLGKHCQEIFKCSLCEPGCGMLVGLNQAPSTPHCTVRLHTENGMERLVVMQHHPDVRRPGPAYRRGGDHQGHHRRSRAAAARSDRRIPGMREVVNFVRRVAASEATTILLEGENGTGKDLIAKTLHYQSMRQAEPFIAINCAAIPETLLESELFGYEKGAFTDARSQKRGIFELADKGTLFLDEIGEIPLMLQAKLLRVLEEQSFRRLGGLKDIKLDLRVVAATNKNLREAVKEGAFRQDLYFRLNVIQILIPPLRERARRHLPLTRFFIDHYNRKFKRSIEGVSDAAAKLLLSHDWPGNVRELRNAIERAMILEETALIHSASLPISISAARNTHTAPEPASPAKPRLRPMDGMSLEDHERNLLVRALEKTNGNQTQAARLLRVTRDTLRYKMKKFSLK